MSHTKSTLDGLYKEVYGESLETLVPDFSILQKKIPFKTKKKTGDKYVEAVQLTNEAGFTYGAGLQALNGAVASSVDDARVSGAPMTLQTGFSYDAAANMASSAQAFQDYSSFRFKTMMAAASYRLELQMLYGNEGLGVADSGQDATTAVVNTNEVTVPILPASWAAGIWSGAEGSYVSLFTTAADTASAADGLDGTVNKFLVASVDTDAKTITLETTDGTEAAALVVEIEAANYNIFFHGSRTNEMTGLSSIASNTGTLWGIDGSTYSLWQGNTYGAGSAALTLAKIFSATTKAVGKGLAEDVTCLVSPTSFAGLNATESGLRQYNTTVDNKKAQRGAEEITFFGPNGKIEVISHPMIKDGEAIIAPLKSANRIGASDLSFKTPGRGEEIFLQMSGFTGFEVRLYSEQAIFMPCPSKAVKITGIA